MDAVEAQVHSRLPYAILYVADLERSATFYEQRLGLRRRDFPVASKLGGIALALQGTTLVLLARDQAGKCLPTGEGEAAPAPGHCYPSFAVNDLAGFHARAAAGGVACAQEPRADAFGRFAVYRDPDGLLFSVVEAARTPATHAVVLSGGGALGAFELGVLSQLAANPAVPDPAILTGTSVGAFNAAVLACLLADGKGLGGAAAGLTAIWRDQVAGGLQDNGVFRLRGDVFRLLDPEAMTQAPRQVLGDLFSDAAFLSLDFSKRLLNLVAGSDTPRRRVIEMVDLSAMLSTEPLRQLVSENVHFDRLKRASCVLRLAATNWQTGRLQLFSHYPDGRAPRADRADTSLAAANTEQAVLASAAIPGIFPAVNIPAQDGTPFVDGGVVMNTPLNPAIEAGAEVIHLICLNPDVDTLPLPKLNNTFDVMQRLLVASVAGHVAADLERAAFANSVAGVARHKHSDDLYRPITIHRYHPPRTNLGGIAGMLDFSLSHINALISDGVECARGHDCTVAGCVVPREHRGRGGSSLTS